MSEPAPGPVPALADPIPIMGRAWPYGPGRPGLATAAGVLARVAAGLTLFVQLLFVAPGLDGHDGVSQWLMLLGLPCAVGMIVGASRLMWHRSSRILFASSAGAVAVLLLVFLVGLGELRGAELIGLAFFVAVALPMPLLAAIFTQAPTVKGWLAAELR